MSSEIPLPGFEHLLEVCRRRGLPLKVMPPLPPDVCPLPTKVEGQLMDPQLTALHLRMRYLWVGDGIYLFPERHRRRPDLHAVNLEWRMWPEPFGSLLVFGKDDRLAYCYAAVPSLVDERGLRPVVWVDVYGKMFALPVASSIDQFLDTYARFLDATPTLVQGGEEVVLPQQTFPWDATALIVRDRELVKRLRTGAFDFLFQNSVRARAWVDALRGDG